MVAMAANQKAWLRFNLGDQKLADGGHRAISKAAWAFSLHQFGDPLTGEVYKQRA
jgi:hypothetical protein